MKTIASSPLTQTALTKIDQIRPAIESWFQREMSDWDALVAGTTRPLTGGADLWARMPKIDSKTVARSSPIFERYFGIPLDVKLIRAGGYGSLDDMIAHLVPAMQAKTQS